MHTFKAGVAFRYDQYTYTSIAQAPFWRVQPERSGRLRQRANGLLPKREPWQQLYPILPQYGALHFRIPSIDFYGSDEWAVTKDLKLTFGVRFEKDINPTCMRNASC